PSRALERRDRLELVENPDPFDFDVVSRLQIEPEGLGRAEETGSRSAGACIKGEESFTSLLDSQPKPVRRRASVVAKRAAQLTR
ncbi:MAG: hypothetical protein WCF24_13025, partial [Acidimicrobiales bacterium]